MLVTPTQELTHQDHKVIIEHILLVAVAPQTEHTLLVVAAVHPKEHTHLEVVAHLAEATPLEVVDHHQVEAILQDQAEDQAVVVTEEDKKISLYEEFNNYNT